MLKNGPYKITFAEVRNVNGHGTAKELCLETTFQAKDDCGTYEGVAHFNIPVEYHVRKGDKPELEGKEVFIEIR